MSTIVTYKGSTLTTVNNQTRTLKTAGKYMEGDVTLTDTSSTIVVSETLDANGGIIKTITTTDEVNLQTKTITPTSSVQTVNPDTGYDGFSQVIVNAGGGGGNVTQDQDGYIVLPKTGGGGGGSSDFSEATVTFINNTSGVEMYGAFIYEYEGDTPTIMCEAWTDDADTQRLVLYKGNSMIQLKAQSGEVITVSGDATVDGVYVYVTGDCTITIS